MDKTFEETKNKIDGEIINDKLFEEIQENPNCYTENNGASGKNIGYNWYTVYEYDYKKSKKIGGEFDIYTK
jgi:hypothetical protein